MPRSSPFTASVSVADPRDFGEDVLREIGHDRHHRRPQNNEHEGHRAEFRHEGQRLFVDRGRGLHEADDETDGEKHVMIVAGDSKDGDAEMKRQVKVTIGSDVDAAKSLEDKILSELENLDFDSENVNIQIKVIAD